MKGMTIRLAAATAIQQTHLTAKSAPELKDKTIARAAKMVKMKADKLRSPVNYLLRNPDIKSDVLKNAKAKGKTSTRSPARKKVSAKRTSAKQASTAAAAE